MVYNLWLILYVNVFCIQPKNILWKDDTYTNLKIVDFGLAVHGLSHTSKVGTPCYIAPELPLTQKVRKNSLSDHLRM